jgi:4-hydroxy-2-oxoheptanedioate aldolase
MRPAGPDRHLVYRAFVMAASKYKEQTMFKKNELKRRLAAGEKAVGCWISLGSPEVTELLGHAGFDYLLLDQEHGLGDLATLVSQLQALSASSTLGIVRVPWNDPVYLKRVLDAGAQGVMIPAIETAEQARAAVAACHYPPAGIRGSGAGGARCSNYGFVKDYLTRAADELLIALQVESITAVENIDEILAVEGVDVIFIGPHDLSATIGHLSEMQHPKVAPVIAHAEQRILASGKAMGTVPHPGVPWIDMFKRGYRFVNAGSDVSRLRDTAIADVRSFREAYGKPD